MNNKTRFAQKQGIDIQQLGSELILYDEQKKTTHLLNPTARCIWELCDGNHTVQDIEGVMVTCFSIPDGQNVTNDIQQVLKTFVGKELLED